MEKAYYFYDTDPTGHEAYDIAGEDFAELIETCCRYCETVSFRIWEQEVKVAEKLEPYRIPKPEAITYTYRETRRDRSFFGEPDVYPDIRYYRVCPELCALLPQIADHLFQWIDGWGYHHPEDPVFYRSDGSVFFSLVIHAGKCTLTSREGEDVSRVVSKGHWLTEGAQRYYFYDTDPTGHEAYDIAGEDFAELIETCCRYCETLSLRFQKPELRVLWGPALEPYRIPRPEAITYIQGHYYHDLPQQDRETCYYRVCPELCALLPQIADHLFQWIDGWGYHHPEDPVFYRSDGSLFFSSVIHEGECILTPREGEDVSRIVSKEHWLTEGFQKY